MKLSQLLVDVAAKEIGVEEVNGSNCGPRVNQYKAATWLPADQSWPWCAAFIDWVLQQAMAAGVAAGQHYTFERPRTAGAWDLRNWSLAQDASTQTKDSPGRDIEPGDVLGYTFSHCGIAASKPDANGYIYAIEGNTDGEGSREGGAVLRKQRHVSKVRFRIRIKV